jgi:endonuclease/exonuclease/phosphatase (EEP) superfamily protein YafD
MALVAGIIGLILTLAIALVTVRPLSRSKRWWIRVWDFPRLQIAAAVPFSMVPALLGPWPVLLVPVLLVCLAYQVWRIRPYTPLVRSEIVFAPDRRPERDVTLLSANVLMENREHAKVRALIETVDPDVIFLMETDQRWLDALSPALTGYSTIVREPKDNHYGFLFATRLPASDARSLRLTLDDTPALYSELHAPGGEERFRFIGLHPRPPVPGEDTDERDAQVLYAARFAHESGVPIVTMGDFNDVAWSDTSQRFKLAGGYLDPRIGRGLFSSFNANHRLVRFPIDQIFVSADVVLADFRLGPHIGSDHFPIIATVRFDAGLAGRLNRSPQPLTGQLRDDVEAGVARHKQRLEAAAEP